MSGDSFSLVSVVDFSLELLQVGSPEIMRSLVASQVLFAKYQMVIHNEAPEECNTQVFYDFLVNSPLEVE
jgi:hypothetical protein